MKKLLLTYVVMFVITFKSDKKYFPKSHFTKTNIFCQIYMLLRTQQHKLTRIFSQRVTFKNVIWNFVFFVLENFCVTDRQIDRMFEQSIDDKKSTQQTLTFFKKTKHKPGPIDEPSSPLEPARRDN